MAEGGPREEERYEEFEDVVEPVEKYLLWSLEAERARVGWRCGDGEMARSGSWFSSWVTILGGLSC